MEHAARTLKDIVSQCSQTSDRDIVSRITLPLQTMKFPTQEVSEIKWVYSECLPEMASKFSVHNEILVYIAALGIHAELAGEYRGERIISTAAGVMSTGLASPDIDHAVGLMAEQILAHFANVCLRSRPMDKDSYSAIRMALFVAQLNRLAKDNRKLLGQIEPLRSSSELCYPQNQRIWEKVVDSAYSDLEILTDLTGFLETLVNGE